MNELSDGKSCNPDAQAYSEASFCDMKKSPACASGGLNFEPTLSLGVIPSDGTNWWLWIGGGAVVVILIGGGLFYFLKKRLGNDDYML
jgi:LPXTG-motif cell wall-anchored protein